VFIPKGAVHLIGPSTFEQVLKENNFFLTTVATVPVNLQYEAWFALIDANQTSDTEPISIHDHLLRQPWFIRLESVTRNKTIIVTTKPNLPTARAWIDANLEPMIRKSIPSDIEPPPSHALPRRLDKPVHTETGRTYAEILKQQFSVNPTETTMNTNINRPPRKRQATVIDYDSDTAESQTIPTAVAPTTHNSNSTPSSNNSNLPSTATPINFATELLSLKNEIQALRTLLTDTVEQIKNEIAAIHSPASGAMEIEDTHPKNTSQHHHAPSTEISSLMQDLRQEIATFVIDTRALLHQKSLPMMQQNHLTSKT